ncbi:MAG: hypothetical protein KDD47_09760, partial [Acidobacteria bacterium]|nr:hypothetical protein [Acidobacteriota bacterium]
RGGPTETVIVDLAMDSRNLDRTLAEGNPVVQGLADLRFFLAGALKIGPTPEGVTVTPLVTTTPEGNTLEIQPGFGGSGGLAYTDLNDPAKLRDRFAPGTEPVVLAALLVGKLPSAYPQGGDFPAEEPELPPGLPPGIELPLPEDTEMIHKDPVPEAEHQLANVLVFADVDFISDQVAFQQSFFGVAAANDNYKLLLNAADFLLGSEELMQVRAKRAIRRPFTLFDRIEGEAELAGLERERQLRSDLETFQSELNEKLGDSTQRNAALLEKRLQDEVERLNGQIKETNRELLEIRKARRKALSWEEAKVRFSVLWAMPALVLGLGLFLSVRRRARAQAARRGTSK